MRAYSRQIGLALLLLLCGGYFLFRFIHNTRPAVSEESCDGETETYVMQDEWMKGSIDKGAEFQALKDWRECHKLARGDLVLYRISASHDPVVKILAGAPGDTFHLKKAANNNSWNIEINGSLFMEGDKPYYFGSANPPALKLYQDTREGILDNRSVVLFSRVSPGDQDSGSLGVLNVEDIVGIVTTSK